MLSGISGTWVFSFVLHASKKLRHHWSSLNWGS